jgi:hypothetical protein
MKTLRPLAPLLVLPAVVVVLVLGVLSCERDGEAPGFEPGDTQNNGNGVTGLPDTGRTPDQPNEVSAPASSVARGVDVVVQGGLLPAPAYDTGELVTAGPVRWGETIVVGTAGGELIGIDHESREERWRGSLGPPVEALSVTQVALYASGGGVVARVSPVTGELLWLVPGAARSSTGLTVSRSAVHAGFDDGSVVALAVGDGAELWRVGLSGTPTGTMTMSDGVLYVATEEGAIDAVDGASGRVAWSHEAAGEYAAGPWISDGRVLAVTIDGEVVVLDPAGNVLLSWTIEASPVLVAPVGHRGGVTIVDGRGVMRSYDRDGSPRWTTSLASHLAGVPARVGDVLFVGEASGGLVAVDLARGEILSRVALGSAPAGDAAYLERALLWRLGDGSVREIGIDGEVRQTPLFTAEGSWVLPESGTFRLADPRVSLAMRSDRDAVFEISVWAAPAEDLVLRVVTTTGTTVATNMGKVELGRSVRVALDGDVPYELVVERPAPGGEITVSVETEQLQ